MNLTSSNGYDSWYLQQIPNARIATDDDTQTFHGYIKGTEEHLLLFPGKNPNTKSLEIIYLFYDWISKKHKGRIVPTIIVDNIPDDRGNRNMVLDLDGEITSYLNKDGVMKMELFRTDTGVFLSSEEFSISNFDRFRAMAYHENKRSRSSNKKVILKVKRNENTQDYFILTLAIIFLVMWR